MCTANNDPAIYMYTYTVTLLSNTYPYLSYCLCHGVWYLALEEVPLAFSTTTHSYTIHTMQVYTHHSIYIVRESTQGKQHVQDMQPLL